MRRLSRIFVNAAAVLSFLLCAAVIAALIRGRWAQDNVYVFRESQDARALRQTAWNVRWAAGDLLAYVESREVDAATARAAGCAPGVRWRTTPYFGWPPEDLRALYRATDAQGWPAWHWDGGPVVLASDDSPGGFVSLAGPSLRGATTAHCIVVRCWLAALIAAVIPASRLAAYVKRRRAARWGRAGKCAGCGYDLRATPDRCPECGAVPVGRR